MDITSQAQLNSVLRAELESYMNIAGARVWKIIDDAIKQYYDNYHPSHYKREYQFYKSCIKTKPKWNGNTVEVEVYIDYNSMVYKPKKVDQERPSGRQIVDWAAEGLHGGLDVGDDARFWEDSMEEIDKGWVLADIANILKTKGFTVVHS